MFDKKKASKNPMKAGKPNPSAPKMIAVQNNPSPAISGKKKRAKELARRRFLIKKAQIVRRRRIVFFILSAVLLLVLLLVVILSINALKNRFGSSNEKKAGESTGSLSAFHAFQKSKDIFYTAGEKEPVTDLCQMLHTYTLADDGINAVPTVTNKPSYYEWDTMKYAWYSDKAYLSALKESIKEIGIAKNGYVWSEEKSATSSVTGSYLYDTNIKFISAVSGICLWDTNVDFLNSVDTTMSGALDISKGKTVGEKLELAVNYVLNTQLSSKNNLFCDTYAANNGTAKGAPSNYWINYRFGNFDAYNNIYFNNAMTKLAKLYQLQGNSEKFDYFNNIAVLNREAFNLFWDNEKGRYIGAIDLNGGKHDFGFVFLNLEAIYYGLADSTKAKTIFSWLDGERTVAGDTSVGSDIYINRFAPRNNTLAADSNWWYDQDDKVLLDSNAAFGAYYQNGGSSLLVSYYDIMARLRTKMPDSAFSRIKELTAEYKKDKLLRNSENATIKFATNGSFSESGLAPAVFVYGLMGLDTDGKTLMIHPQIPSSYGAVGLKKIGYANNSYALFIDGKSAYITAETYSPIRINFGGYKAGQKVTYSYFEKSKAVITDKKTADSSGTIYIEEAFGKNSFIKLSTE